jgi:hypothetical protein
VEPLTGTVLSGSAVHVQCHGEICAWRILSDPDAIRHKSGIQNPVTWRPWTGDLTSVLVIGLTRRREGGARERWWIVVGELPSPDSVVAPMVSDGQLPRVHVIQDRLWACEWSGKPTTAEVAVDGRLAYVHDFKVRPYFTGAEQRPDPPLGKRHDWH